MKLQFITLLFGILTAHNIWAKNLQYSDLSEGTNIAYETKNGEFIFGYVTSLGWSNVSRKKVTIYNPSTGSKYIKEDSAGTGFSNLFLVDESLCSINELSRNVCVGEEYYTFVPYSTEERSGYHLAKVKVIGVTLQNQAPVLTQILSYAGLAYINESPIISKSNKAFATPDGQTIAYGKDLSSGTFYHQVPNSSKDLLMSVGYTIDGDFLPAEDLVPDLENLYADMEINGAEDRFTVIRNMNIIGRLSRLFSVEDEIVDLVLVTNNLGQIGFRHQFTKIRYSDTAKVSYSLEVGPMGLQPYPNMPANLITSSGPILEMYAGVGSSLVKVNERGESNYYIVQNWDVKSLKTGEVEVTETFDCDNQQLSDVCSEAFFK